jgi:elongator complex protein 2
MADLSPVQLNSVSAGCNRVVGALDWGKEGLIAYCTHHAIAIYNPATSSIVSTLLGHTDTVTCLKWFKASDFGLESNSSHGDQLQTLVLASGGGDGSVCIWLLTLSNVSQPWTLAATLPAHKAAITSITIHSSGSPGQIVLVTTAGDGDVSIWTTPAAKDITHPASLLSNQEEHWKLIQRLSYGTKLQHCSAMTTLPSEPTSLLLALGGVNGKVRLLLSSFKQEDNNNNNEFKLVCELAGHQNWVRGLDFTHQGSKILLASASQDKYIRLWAITPEEKLSNTTTNTTTATLAASLMKFAPRPRFSSPSRSSAGGGGTVSYQATLEALLIGHEDWVHSVAWKPRNDRDGEEEIPCLLSASMDRTMALWVPDKATGELFPFLKDIFQCGIKCYSSLVSVFLIYFCR